MRMVENTPTILSGSRVIEMENEWEKFEKIGLGEGIVGGEFGVGFVK